MAQSGLCRLCAEAKNGLVGIYENEGQKLMIGFKIAKCLQIQVKLSAKLSFATTASKICVISKENEQLCSSSRLLFC